MIQKISFLDSSVNCVDCKGFVHNVAEGGIINKINELVDAVNGILDYAPLEMAMKSESKPADKYAEQRKWIGKLCKFRDNYEDKWHFGVLEEIYERSDFPFGDFDNFEWAICEPVKPDDDIIYKGE